MKTKALLLFSLFLTTVAFTAFSQEEQDQFTIGNIFDFNVGDIFQYSYQIPDQGFGKQTKIMDKYYSDGMDTVFYEVERITWEVEPPVLETVYEQIYYTTYYTNLDSAFLIDGTDTTYYDSRLCDDSIKVFMEIDGNDFEPIISASGYGLGLGFVSYDFGASGEGVSYSYQLSYYRKGDEECGSYNDTYEDVSVGEIDEESTRVFPNPSRGNIEVITSFVAKSAELFDQFGRSSYAVENLSSKNFRLDLRHLPSGVYFLKVEGDVGVMRKRVVLE